MRDLGLYVLAVLMGALLGLSGGVVASFAVGQSDGGSPRKSPLSSEDRGPTPSHTVKSDKPSAIPDPDAPSSREQRAPTDSRAPGQHSPSRATRLDGNRLVVRSLPASSPLMREKKGLMVTMSQPPSFVQWAREVMATGLLMPVGDVTLDGVVNIEDLATVALAFGTTSPQPPWLDLNGDGVVNRFDLTILVRHFGEGG